MFRELDIYTVILSQTAMVSTGTQFVKNYESQSRIIQAQFLKTVSPRRKMLGPLCNQTVNPLSPISAQDQFSHNDIHRLS